MRRPLRRLIFAVALAALSSSRLSPQAQTPPPQFRAGITLVPVEVHVVDKDGYPIRDLTKADFAIREDGVAQELALFQPVALDGAESAAPRTFIIVLGRGQLDAPTKAVQALTDFVRSKLLPVDQVSIVAYRKAIEPTTNHEAVARFLDRFRERHEAIEGRIARDQRGGLRSTIAPATRAAIDAMFAGASLKVRDLSGSAGALAAPYLDYRYLQAALRYLRAIEGEKHTVLVTERPFVIASGKKPSENYWFKLAAPARTALSFINAGGLTGGIDGGRPSFLGLWPGSVDSQEWVAEQTGGTATFFQFAAKPLTALDRATRFHYLIGYYPTREAAPDAYRDIEVTVKRAGATLLYRHGYQVQATAEDSKDYRRIATAARIEEAAWMMLQQAPLKSSYMGSLKLTFMRLRVLGEPIPDAGGSVRLSVSILPDWPDFRKAGAGYAAEFDLGLFADDQKGKIVAEHTQRVNVTLTPAEYERSKRVVMPEWLSFEVTFDVKTKPAVIRGVLYQFDTDRATTAQVRVR